MCVYVLFIYVSTLKLLRIYYIIYMCVCMYCVENIVKSLYLQVAVLMVVVVLQNHS